MTILQEEFEIMKMARKEMFKASGIEELNKLYGNAKMWNKLHFSYAGACTYEKYIYITKKLKHFRMDVLKSIN